MSPALAAPRKAVAKRPMASAPGVLRTQKAATDLSLSVGRGQLINLPSPIADVFVANENVADVQVRSATQIYVFAKAAGESTIFATSRSGAVVYSANVRTGNNVNSVDSMLKLAMPEASIVSTPMNGMILLTGTVAGPDDGAEAESLVQAFVGDTTKVVSRLRTATPLQVNLQVKIAEVNRSLVKSIGVNLATLDTTGGFQFGIQQGGSVAFDPKSGAPTFAGVDGGTSIAGFGKLLGVDIGSALDLAETQGLVTTLAQPNLTALSGETASFLAGGEFPIPISQDIGTVTIQYKQYGVSLAFTPTVLADGRISMRVRPEVSELTNEGSLRLNGFNVPGITTRRAETTIELGSGQAFMIGGLLRNTQTNSIDRAPGLGNIPILGALFRSTSFRKSETELVIVVTPYLVKPVSANQIALPTDGFKAATDAERVFLGKLESGKTGEKRPTPTMAPPATVTTPSVGAMLSPPKPSEQQGKKSRDIAAPGFSGN
jgi:pilus assembly protein CpaC